MQHENQLKNQIDQSLIYQIDMALLRNAEASSQFFKNQTDFQVLQVWKFYFSVYFKIII